MREIKRIITKWIDEEIEAKESTVAGKGVSIRNADAAIRETMLFSVMDQIDKMIKRNETNET